MADIIKGPWSNKKSNKSERMQHELELAKNAPTNQASPPLEVPTAEGVVQLDEAGLRFAERSARLIIEGTSAADLSELSRALAVMRAIKDTHRLAAMVVEAAELPKSEFALDVPKYRAAALVYMEKRYPQK